MDIKRLQATSTSLVIYSAHVKNYRIRTLGRRIMTQTFAYHQIYFPRGFDLSLVAAQAARWDHSLGPFH